MSIDFDEDTLEYDELKNEEDGVNLFPNDEDGDELTDYILRDCD
jgi:hypothetical protein